MKDKSILIDAISQYGEEMQLNQAVEECAEFIVAVNKLRRSKYSPESTNALISEVADVIIMMNQMSIILGEKDVNNQIVFKLDRLKQRLK